MPEPDDVSFLAPAGGDEPAEELPGRAGGAARTRRVRRDLLVGALGLIAALVVVRLVSHHATTPSGHASSSPAAASTAPVRSADVAAPGCRPAARATRRPARRNGA